MNKKTSKRVLVICIILIGIVLYLLVSFDFEVILNKFQFYINFKNNLLFIVDSINKVIPLLGMIMLLIISFIIFQNKWVLKIEKINIGGASVEFNKPEVIFSQNIRNFLNTKRTLFKFDADRDNIYDTLASFYQSYNFIREQLKIYDPKSSNSSKSYEAANKMIYVLNEFLTEHQDNFRRWYEFTIKKDNIFDEDISELQKVYRHYDLIVADINELNKQFIDYAEIFNIDTEKWSEPKFKHKALM